MKRSLVGMIILTVWSGAAVAEGPKSGRKPAAAPSAQTIAGQYTCNVPNSSAQILIDIQPVLDGQAVLVTASGNAANYGGAFSSSGVERMLQRGDVITTNYATNAQIDFTVSTKKVVLSTNGTTTAICR